jgi:hypothetical protein
MLELRHKVGFLSLYLAHSEAEWTKALPLPPTTMPKPCDLFPQRIEFASTSRLHVLQTLRVSMFNSVQGKKTVYGKNAKYHSLFRIPIVLRTEIDNM